MGLGIEGWIRYGTGDRGLGSGMGLWIEGWDQVHNMYGTVDRGMGSGT